MKQYLTLVDKVLKEGIPSTDRTGVGTIRLFGEMLTFDLKEGFPLLTTRKTSLKVAFTELMWMLNGETNSKWLEERGVNIWKANADNQGKALGLEEGGLGEIYGYQWRRKRDARHYSEFTTAKMKTGYKRYLDSAFYLRTYDQIAELIRLMKEEPDSRRMVVNSWDITSLPFAALPPCHNQFQVQVMEKEGVKYVNLIMYQRSCDVGVGLPINITFYALLTHLLAHFTGYEVGVLKIMLGDVHIYNNHVEKLKEQLLRTPKPLPVLSINGFVDSIEDYTFDMLHLEGYDPYPYFKLDMAV